MIELHADIATVDSWKSIHLQKDPHSFVSSMYNHAV